MKSYILLIIILLCSPLNVLGNVYFRHLGKADGLSQLSVMSVCQDELGRMWFGTLEGLNCYDGMHIKTFKHSEQNSLLGNETFNIVSDKKGSLFFISDKNLLHFDIYKETFTQLSKKNASTLYEHNNQVWMATRDSIFEWDSSKRQFQFLLSHPSVKVINCLHLDQQGRFWVGTQNGLYRFDHTRTHHSPACIIPKTTITSLYNDSHNNMWVAGFRNGMYKITSDTIAKYVSNGQNSLSNNDVRTFVEDNTGNLWIATFNGLNRLDPQGNFTYYTKDYLQGSLKHASIFSLYKDMQGTIWLGTYYGGVQYFNPEADLFNHYSENVNRDDCLSFFFVGKMVEDKRGDIWICTDGGGLNKLDRNTRRFTHYLADGKPNSIPFNNLKCIAYDEKRDRLYIGTHTKGLFSFDIQTGKTTCYTDLEKTGNIVTHMLLHENKLIFSSTKGLIAMDLNTGIISDLFPGKKITKHSNTFTIDSNNYIWIVQPGHILRINLKNPNETETYRYEERGLGKFPVTKIIENKEGEIILGTSGSGLLRYDKEQNIFVRYTEKDGWNQSNYCYDIALSTQGYLIVSGEEGISIFDPVKKSTKVVDLEDKLYLSGLNDGCGLLVCRNGEVFVGGTDGMTSFMENRLFDSAPSYTIYFSSIAINNQIIHPDASGVLKNALPFSSKIELKYNQNDITVTFTSNNYIKNLQQISYEYMLEGFDKRWITSADQKIVYTNIDPGNYTLIVREKKQDDTARSIRLQIVIHSPWYATWIAYVSYLILLSAIAFAIIRNRRSKMLLELSLDNEKREKEKNEEIIQAKLQFFSNISHEFRTPLTLIISQMEMLLQNRKISPFLHTRLLKIYRNTFQLRELISELLDFRKVEQGGMNLKVSHMNLISFLKKIYQEFQDQAVLHEVDFHFTAPTEELAGWYDAKQLKRVMFNLLSNAFKFTPKQGKIDLIVEEQENYITIKVIDSGQGITEEELQHIFDRFYQSSTSMSKEAGTGIGLALVKGLVELHHGEIQVHSALGYGSIFTVLLPKENVFTDDKHIIFVDSKEQAQEEVQSNVWSANTEDNAIDESQTIIDESDKACILIVEDNEDLLQILVELLSPLYKVIIALNGKDGLEKAMEERPDLILSDIMMPVMSGIELCLKIKNNFDICHIPVILLTALTSEEKNIEGLQCGADDYIGKPFNNKILISKIANTLRNRNLLKRKHKDLFDNNSSNNNNSNNNNIHELALNTIDQQFLTRLNQIIEEHLSDPEFDVNVMAKEIGISRSSFYSKLKALSCMTPSEFVLNIKLKRAADMLKNCPELQITEIAYQLGFNSPRYFRYCFKAQFNQTPQEYRNK